MAKKKATTRKPPTPFQPGIPPATCKLFRDLIRDSRDINEVTRAKLLKALSNLSD